MCPSSCLAHVRRRLGCGNVMPTRPPTASAPQPPAARCLPATLSPAALTVPGCFECLAADRMEGRWLTQVDVAAEGDRLVVHEKKEVRV